MKSIYKKNSITQLKLTLVGLLTVLLLIQLVRPQKNTSLTSARKPFVDIDNGSEQVKVILVVDC